MRLTTFFSSAVLIGLMASLSSDSVETRRRLYPDVQAKDARQSLTEDFGWQRVDAGAFSISAPRGWNFHQLRGVDSYVGEFAGDGIVLKFDFGGYANPFKEQKSPGYFVVHKLIGGHPAKIVSPKAPGNGITGIYFLRTFGSNKLSLFGQNLTSAQQQLVLKIFETIRFGSTVPPVVPPPAKNVQ